MLEEWGRGDVDGRKEWDEAKWLLGVEPVDAEEWLREHGYDLEEVAGHGPGQAEKVEEWEEEWGGEASGEEVVSMKTEEESGELGKIVDSRAGSTTPTAPGNPAEPCPPPLVELPPLRVTLEKSRRISMAPLSPPSSHANTTPRPRIEPSGRRPSPDPSTRFAPSTRPSPSTRVFPAPHTTTPPNHPPRPGDRPPLDTLHFSGLDPRTTPPDLRDCILRAGREARDYGICGLSLTSPGGGAVVQMSSVAAAGIAEQALEGTRLLGSVIRVS